MGLKTISPPHRNPKDLPKYFFRYFHHFIGKGFHGDFRWKQNGYLRGWTIATAYPGKIKEPINTVAKAKEATRDLDTKFKPDMEPTKHVLAFTKAKQPIEWAEMYNKVIEPGAGPGASKEERGVFVLVDEGMAYPGASKPYFQELFLAGKQFKGRMVVRQLETPKEWEKAGGPGEPMNWQIWMTKEQVPYILTPRGRETRTNPPDNESWLSPEWEKKIPADLQWWKKPSIKGKARSKLIDQAFNYLIEKKELKHRPLDISTEELNLKEGKFALRYRSWRGQIAVRAMPVIHYDLLIDIGKKCLSEWTMVKNPLASPVTGVTAKIGELCKETPDGKPASDWLEWEGSIPPKGISLSKAKIIRKIPDTTKYIISVDGKELESKPTLLRASFPKPGMEIWTDNRRFIYTTNKGTEFNPNKAIPIYFNIFDSGKINWIEDSELFSSFRFYGKKLKDYWIMKREEPSSNLAVFRRSELPEQGDRKMRDFKFAYPLRLGKKHPAEIEILREGVWEHPEALDGVLEITKNDLLEFSKNFKDKIVGEEIPLDLEHKPEKGHAIGWIKKLWTKFQDGIWHLWAKMDITDEKAQADLKSGSLKYISPQILIGWKNPEDTKTYNVIRSAALTNYPFIKNMHPAVLNFEEIKEEVNQMLTEEEILEKEKELKTREGELLGKETKLSEAETKLSEKETELSEKVEKLEENEKSLKQAQELQEGKYPGPFHGLPKAQAVSLGDKCKGGDQKSCDILIKYATGGIYGYPKAQLEEMLREVGIVADFEDIEFTPVKKDEMDSLNNRVAALEASTKAKDKALEVATSDLAVLKQEKQEMEVDTHVNVLLAGGKIVPAQKELLRSIFLADGSSGTIELEEEGGKKKKLDKNEAIMHLLTTGPDKVNLTQKGVVTGATDNDMKEAKKIINMTTEEWAKLTPEEREIKLKELDTLQEKVK